MWASALVDVVAHDSGMSVDYVMIVHRRNVIFVWLRPLKQRQPIFPTPNQRSSILINVNNLKQLKDAGKHIRL
jgi:hypothetical protein